jgi:cytochrome c-type biogenesis protein CcmH/NrfF
MSEDGLPRDPVPEEGGAAAPGAPGPRRANLAVVAAAIILVGLVAYALSRRPTPPARVSNTPAGESTPPPAGTAIAAVVPYHLSPEASVVAERYRCVCSCGDLLNVCTCSKTPGSNDMKRALQDLVNQKKSPDEIDRAMVEKFGPQVLLANPVPTPSPVGRPPAARRRNR